MQMPGRKYQQGNSKYRYSINGQEKETELNENITTAEFWEYDSRIVRRWNIDPKPNISLSPYNCFAGNPILFSDSKGDSIPTKFYGSDGKQTNVIPAEVQKMYNDEYGIKVGYDAKKGLLYKESDVKTDNVVSPTAKNLWDRDLGDGVTKGSLVFGFGLAIETKRFANMAPNVLPVPGGITISNVSYIDLLKFNGTGGLITLKSTENVPIRARNLARVVEHEFFGHNKFDKRDAPRPSGVQYNPGPAERIVNVFRRQMGLPIALDYGANETQGSIRYGNSNPLLQYDKSIPIIGTQEYYNDRNWSGNLNFIYNVIKKRFSGN